MARAAIKMISKTTHQAISLPAGITCCMNNPIKTTRINVMITEITCPPASCQMPTWLEFESARLEDCFDINLAGLYRAKGVLISP